MENKIVVSSYRAYSSREQARFIRQEANVLLEKANEFSTTSRRVNRRSAYKVLARSLQKTRGLPFSIRKHQALTELSNYISLAKYNKVIGLEAFNTDLLPTSHPRSTRMNSMSASAIAEAQMRWILDDPRIKDETVKSLLASAMFSPIDSPEHKYSMIRLENMPQGQVPLEVLIAAANPFAGKNSAAARRAREAVQLSDRFERWINMGRSAAKRATDGFRVYVARNDGSTRSLSGELLNQNMFDPNLVDIEMGKGKVATVPTKLGEGLEAFIKSKDSDDGYSPTEAEVPQGAQVLPENSIVVSDAPSIYRKDEDMQNGAVRYTDDKYDIVKYNNPKDAQKKIDEGQKRAAELDKAEPKLLKKGETDPDSGRQFWNPDEPVLAVYRRGKDTPLAFAQSWKDVNNEILRDEPFLDEDEGREYTRPEPQTADDNVPLLDQADEIFKPTKKKADKKKKEVSSFPYEVPERAYEFNPNEEYTPEFEFDDPVTIANDQMPEELEDALLTAVEPISDTEKATGYAPISFTDGRERDVPAEAIAAAIREKGGDAELSLAQAYDKIAGNNNNEKALLESRGDKDPVLEGVETTEDDEIVSETEPTPSDKIIEDEIVKPEPKATTPESTDGVEDVEDVSEDTYVPPLLEGLSEEELASFKEDGDYRPFLPKNADVDTPEGLYKLDPNPVDPATDYTPKDQKDEYPSVTPLDLSTLPVKTLTSDLESAINGTSEHGPGFGELIFDDPNMEKVNVPIPAEALRDALQLKGKDTDAIIEKINKKAAKAKAKIKPPASEEPEVEPDTKEEEPKPKKTVNYKRSGNRTLLRAGKGGAFKDKEIADFLDENGFEWTGTIERDGETLPVNSESALQTDEEFKAFARELRDRFGIDLEPRAATAKSPAQEPIDIDAPAPEPEAPTPAPTPEEVKPKLLPEFLQSLFRAIREGRVNGQSFPRSIMTEEERELFDSLTGKDKNEQLDIIKDMMAKLGIEPEEFDSVGESRPELPKEIREEDIIFGMNISGKKIAPEDQRQIRAADGALFDGNGKFVGYIDDSSFNLSNSEMSSWLDSYYKKLESSEKPSKYTKKLPQDLKPGDEVYIPGVGWRIVKSVSERKFDDKRKPSIWTVEYTDGNPRYPTTGQWKTMKGWKNQDGTDVDDSLYTRDPLGVPGDETPSSQQIVIQGEAPEGVEEPKVETPLPEGVPNLTPQELPETIKQDNTQIAGLPAGTTAISRDLDGRTKTWIKQEDGTWVNTGTGEIVDELPDPIQQYGGVWWNDYEFFGPGDAIPEAKTPTTRPALIPTPTPQVEPEAVEETPKTEEQKNFIRKTAALLFDQVGKALSAVKADKGIKALEGLTDRQLYDLFGPFNVLELTELLKRAMESDKESVYGNRKDMISKIMFLEFKPGFRRDETPYIQKYMNEFENKLRRMPTKELEAMLDVYYDDMDAMVAEQNEEKEKAEELKRARERRRQAAIEKLLEKYGDDADAEKPEEEVEPEPEVETPAEPPLPPLSADAKEILKALIDRRRKIQRKIDKADLDETTTAAKKKALKDELDEVTRIIDSLVLGEKPAEKPEETTAAEVKETEKPQEPQPSITSVFAPNLKAGDVFKDDYFTIVSIETGLTKERDMEIVPATRLTGYYPNSVEQSTKLWADDTEVDVYRGVTPPSKGDLPVLSKPEMKSFSPTGRLQIIGTFTRPNGTIGKKWGLKNPADVEKYNAAMDEYKEERKRRMALWTPPEVTTANNDNANTPVKSVEESSYVTNVPARLVQVGDIAIKKNKYGAKEFFTITKVVSSNDESTVLEGHYVGHQTQTKEWRSSTPIDIIRGEKNLPAAGDKEPLDRPDKSLPNYSQLEKERQAKIAEADKGYKYGAEDAVKSVPKPRLPAFYGSAELLLDLGDGTNIQAALDARENGYVVFDFETLGIDVNNVLNPDAPIQAAAVRYVGGKKVEELNIYINPEKPLGDYYYETDSEGKKTLRPNRMRDAEGNPITDEWLATQPSIQEQLQKLVDFFGPDPILVGQNIGFDLNVLQRWSQKVGIDFELKGSIDTLPIAQALQKIERTTVTFPENPEEGDEALSALGNAWTWTLNSSGVGSWKAPSNSLNQLAERLGVTTDSSDFHNALFDVEVTDQVLRKQLETLKAGQIPTGASAAYAEGFKKWVLSLAEEKKRVAKREADKIVSEAFAGKPVNADDVDTAVEEVNSVTEEPVTITGTEESSDSPKEYVSPLYGDILNEDWVKDPENTDFISNARIKDLKVSDFITGSDGELYEIIKLEDDEVQPGNAVRIIRANLNTGQILEERQSEREDGGTGFFLVGKVDGGFYRRKDNADKSSAQIETETIEAIPDVEPVVIPEVQPVKGEDVTPEQVATVVNTAIDEITTSKPDASIEEAVKGLNVDETIKEAVVTKPENEEVETGFHISADEVTVLKRDDKVIHINTKRTGTVSVLLKSYQGGKYKNYVKVRYDDTNEREPVAAKNLSIVFRPEVSSVYKPKGGETTVKDIENKIKDLQGTTPAEGAPDAQDLAERFKAAEKERDEKAKETNFVKTSTSVVSKIKENLPIKGTTQSSVPSLKTGNLYDVTLAFDKPTVKELEQSATELNIDSEDDLLVFRAAKDLFLRNQPLATIKPDGSIVWHSENNKQKVSLELQKILEDFSSPITNLSAMAIMPEPEDMEGTDDDNYGNGTLLGESESTFDYNNISKFPPTEEQKKIIEAVISGKDVVVQALAGTGKTSTLVLTANRFLDQDKDLPEKDKRKLLYIVFNREAAEEAQGRMPKNVDSRTMDNIVYSMVPANYRNRNTQSDTVKIGERSLIDGRDYVNLFEYYKFEPVTVSIKGSETILGRNELVAELQEVIKKFVISADEVISEKHFARKDPFFDSVPPVLLQYVNRMWDDVSTEEGWDPTSKKLSRVTFGDMLKSWALTKPQFAAGLNSGSTSLKPFTNRKNTLFFFDEAQDMNPVIVDLLANQKGIQRVYVGDSNQAIYAFRGAVDELNNVRNATELYLTQTFRFGPKLAGPGNRFLTLLGSKNKIVGKPGEDDGELVENMQDPTMFIPRTNGRLIDELFDMLAKGKNPGLNLETYYKALSYAKSVKWLMDSDKPEPPKYKKPKIHEDFSGFNNWKEVLKAVQDGKSVGGAGYMVRLVRDRKLYPEQIIEKINNITPIRGTGFRTDEYVPVGKEAVKDGTIGVFGKGKLNSGFKGDLVYRVNGNTIEFENAKSYQDFLLRNKQWVTKQYKKKDGTTGEYAVPTVSFEEGQEEEMLTLINDVRRWVQNYPPRIPIDTELITAHKSKGKESDRVKLGDDYAEPEFNEETGEFDLPNAEELRISYVAATRGKKALDIGDKLKWIYQRTTEDDEKPQPAELTEVENLLGMSVIPDPEPVTPEEIGNQVIKDRKITDQKTLEVAEKLVELIKKGVVPWRQGWSGGKLFNPKTKHTFQGSNVLTLWGAMAENDWSDPRFLNIKQVNALGGRVIKGSKGTTILKPNGNFKNVKQPDGTIKKEGYVWFSTESYFNVAQVTGIEFPPLIKKEPVPVLDIETQILESYKDHPEIINRFQSGAFYRPSEDKIYLPLREQFDSSIDFIETLFHELGHSTGHPSRLGKDGKRKDLLDNYGDHRASRGEEELIADITVALIAAEFGVEIDWGNTASYVDGWLKPLQDDPGMIIVAARQAQQAVNWILGIKPEDENSGPAASFPELQDYSDGGSGGLVGSRSTVGFVSTEALKDMAGNTAGNEEAIESYRKSLREGKGFTKEYADGKSYNEPIMVVYDNETGLAYVGEGNHRLQAAIAENIPYVPVRVVRGNKDEMVDPAYPSRTPKQIKNDKEPGFLETSGSSAGQPVSEGYVPPSMHPSFVFDKELVSDEAPNFRKLTDPFGPPEPGEGVGSEGQTGEEIAGQAPETPEVTPEPNVGEQGQTGEEIASKAPKNKDASVEPEKFTFMGEEYDLWNDITYDRESKEGSDNDQLEYLHGIFAKRLLEGQELITDRNEINNYITEILKKYGYGNKFFMLASGAVSNKVLGKDPMKGDGSGVEAGVGRSNDSIIPDNSPLKGVEFPVFLARSRGISKVAMLHEIAHLMESGWRSGVGGGHNQVWHQTFLTLLRQEGFQTQANTISSAMGELKGDTGAINP